MVAQAKNRISPEEYLLQERKASTRSEYLAGKIYAMAGASPNHNTLTVNVSASLHAQLRGKPCHVWANDMRVKVNVTGLYTYPDILVVCGELQFDDAQRDTLLNPGVLIEVLSASTEAYDRGEKFAHYRTLESLTDYVLISQDRVRIEHFVRLPDNRWLYNAIGEPQDSIELEGIGCTLTPGDVYEQVVFPIEP